MNLFIDIIAVIFAVAVGSIGGVIIYSFISKVGYLILKIFKYQITNTKSFIIGEELNAIYSWQSIEYFLYEQELYNILEENGISTAKNKINKSSTK